MNQNSTILIVDDQPSGRQVLEMLLAAQGYQLAFASNGPEALAKAAEVIPDLILLDVMMPGMDGFEVCRRLRADPHLAEVPVMLVTALDDRGSRLQGIEAGADDFVTKPFDRVELRARVQTITRLNRFRRLLSERAKFERLVDLSPDGIMIVDAEGVIHLANPAMLRMLGFHRSEALLGKQLLAFVAPEEHTPAARWLASVTVDGSQIAQTETVFIRLGGIRFPVEAKGGYFTWDNRPAAQIVVRDITERKRAEEQIQRQLQHLVALRNVDMAITASLDLSVTLNVLLSQVTSRMRVDAADVLLLNPTTQFLEYAAGSGFRGSAITRVALRLGEGLPGRAALECRPISAANLLESEEAFRRAQLLAEESFIAYYGVPLIVKGQAKGVLEIFHRGALTPDPEWLNFLEALAAHAAIAIDNAALFDNIQRSNIELALAYDATIEGWSRALELRDKETEGHSLRVTEMTMHLARAMSLSEAELIHVRRGALLHDIGKMGIPDAILLKPGPLDDEEREIMRRHPVYAYEMLSPIEFLRPALDIPHYHHEKWDGTGYPTGLKGKHIPLSARIFAVIDVWDALRSDRPYRRAWSEEKVRNHIQELIGSHFDPEVADAFLSIGWEPPPSAK